MCDNLLRSRAAFLQYAVSKNAEAMLKLSERIVQYKLSYCEEHKEAALQLAQHCKDSAGKIVERFFSS